MGRNVEQLSHLGSQGSLDLSVLRVIGSESVFRHLRLALVQIVESHRQAGESPTKKKKIAQEESGLTTFLLQTKF
jgi:hypothetical protein